MSHFHLRCDNLTVCYQSRPAVHHVTAGRDLALVVGYAGTGKSAMLGVARVAWEAAGYRVRGAALSGIAAEGLEGGSGIESRTLASLEWGWKEGRDQLTARDVLVVDEAGMVGSRQMERVLSHAREAGAKVVLVGDPEQLQAIEAGAAFRALAERHGAAEIGTVRRQRADWQRDATRELATARTADALGRYEAAGMVQGHGTQDEARAALVAGWAAERHQSPQQSQVMLAYTRADVAELNGLARDRLRAAGELGEDHQVETERGQRAMARGDRLMFLRNERGLGAGPGRHGGVAVKNGTLGTVLAVESGGERLTVRLDGPGQEGKDAPVVTFYTRDYAHLDHGYAATVHKAQGVTVDRAHVLASAHMDRHAAYVALTRHREGVALHWSAEAVGDRAGLGRTLGRERAKDTSLDYGGPERAYAERRGLDPLRPESEIVVQRPGPRPDVARGPEQAPPAPRSAARPAASAAAVPAPGPELAQDVAQGRARFRERFEAHRRQQAQHGGGQQALVAEVGRVARGGGHGHVQAQHVAAGVGAARGRQPAHDVVGQLVPADAVQQYPWHARQLGQPIDETGGERRRCLREQGRPGQRRPARSGGSGTAWSDADATTSLARSCTLRPRDRATLRSRSKASRGVLPERSVSTPMACSTTTRAASACSSCFTDRRSCPTSSRAWSVLAGRPPGVSSSASRSASTIALVRSPVGSPPTSQPPPGLRRMTIPSRVSGPRCVAMTWASLRSTAMVSSATTTLFRSMPHSVATTSPAASRTGTPT